MRVPLRPPRVVGLAQRAGDEHLAEEHQAVAEDHREAEQQRQKDRHREQAERPVAAGERLDDRDDVEDRAATGRARRAAATRAARRRGRRRAGKSGTRRGRGRPACGPVATTRRVPAPCEITRTELPRASTCRTTTCAACRSDAPPSRVAEPAQGPGVLSVEEAEDPEDHHRLVQPDQPEDARTGASRGRRSPPRPPRRRWPRQSRPAPAPDRTGLVYPHPSFAIAATTVNGFAASASSCKIEASRAIRAYAAPRATGRRGSRRRTGRRRHNTSSRRTAGNPPTTPPINPASSQRPSPKMMAVMSQSGQRGW